MLPFEALLGGSEAPERSLLICFEASLPFFERVLLGRLSSHGEGAVAVLVDAADYAQSFADASAVTRVGVDYTFAGATLPGPRAAFHAKLYLTLGKTGAQLIVASANLTPTGVRSNVEVVDRLSLSADGAGDRAAFAVYAELIANLPILTPGLSSDALRALKRAADAVLQLLSAAEGTPPGDDHGPRLLHSAVRPLLEQLQALVPADEVTEIVAISPFYDGGSRAILALASAYPGASLRIIKDRLATGDIDGRALIPLGKRVRVERLDSVSRSARRLHAKVIALMGPRTSWLVTGSANLTAAAWLRSASSGGNLEAVVVRSRTVGRRSSSGTSAEAVGAMRLLGALKTSVVAHARLQFELPNEATQGSLELSIPIRSVAAMAGRLEIECDAGLWEPSDGVVDLHLSSRDTSAVTHASIVRRTATAVTLVSDGASPAVESLLLGDAAVLATLTCVSADSIAASGRGWLDKPEYLRLSAEARRSRHALAVMAQQMFVQDVHLHRVAEWLLHTATALAATLASLGGSVGDGRPDTSGAGTEAFGAHGGASGARGIATSDPGTPTPDSDSPIAFDDFDVAFGDDILQGDTDDAPLPGGDQTSFGHGMSRVDAYLRGAVRIVDALFRRQDHGIHGDSVRHPDSPRGGAAQGHAEDTEDGAPDRSSDAEADRLLRASASDVARAIDHVLRVRPTPEMAARAVATLEVLLAYLFRLALHAKLWRSAAAPDCLAALRRAWQRTWSVDGWEQGSCSAWTVRIWSSPTLAGVLDGAWAEGDRVARLMALAAASAALDDSPEGGRVPTGILVGLQVVTGGSIMDLALAAQVRIHAESLAAQSGQLLTPDAVYSALRPASLSDTKGAAIVRPWIAIVRVLQARRGGTPLLNETVTAFESVADPATRAVAKAVAKQLQHGRPVAGVYRVQEALCCGECGVRIADRLAQVIGRPEARVHACESCGALLVPVAWADPVCAALLAAADRLDISNATVRTDAVAAPAVTA
jgi:hypothetical protein